MFQESPEDSTSEYTYYNWIPEQQIPELEDSPYFLMKFCVSKTSTTYDCTPYSIAAIHVSIPKWGQTGYKGACHVTLEIFSLEGFPKTRKSVLQYYNQQTQFAKPTDRDVNRILDKTNFKIYYYPQEDDWKVQKISNSALTGWQNRFVEYNRTKTQILKTRVFLYTTGPFQIRTLLLNVWKQFVETASTDYIDYCYHQMPPESQPVASSSSTPLPSQRQKTFVEMIQEQLQGPQASSGIFQTPTGQMVVIPEQLSSSRPVASSSRIQEEEQQQEEPTSVTRRTPKKSKPRRVEEFSDIEQLPEMSLEQIQDQNTTMDLYFAEYEILQLLGEAEIATRIRGIDLILLLEYLQPLLDSATPDDVVMKEMYRWLLTALPGSLKGTPVEIREQRDIIFNEVKRLWRRFDEMNLTAKDIEGWYRIIKETIQLFWDTNPITIYEQIKQIETNLEISKNLLTKIIENFRSIRVPEIYQPMYEFLLEYMINLNLILTNITTLIRKKKSIADNMELFKESLLTMTYSVDFLTYMYLTIDSSFPNSNLDRFFKQNKTTIFKFIMGMYSTLHSLIQYYRRQR